MSNKFEKATSRPWLSHDNVPYVAMKYTPDGAAGIVECLRDNSSDAESRENLKLIVAAVNSFDARRELLEAARVTLDRLAAWRDNAILMLRSAPADTEEQWKNQRDNYNALIVPLAAAVEAAEKGEL